MTIQSFIMNTRGVFMKMRGACSFSYMHNFHLWKKCHQDGVFVHFSFHRVKVLEWFQKTALCRTLAWILSMTEQK